MSNDQRVTTSRGEDDDHMHIRDIHAITPPRAANHGRPLETNSHISSSLSTGSSDGASSENFTSLSREFNRLLVLADGNSNNDGASINGSNNLARIGDHDDGTEETNLLAIVQDNNPIASPGRGGAGESSRISSESEVSVQSVRKEEAEAKISAWQTAKLAKINNRFKREKAIIHVWESEQVQKATTRMKKVERKLEEKRAIALEKMENEVARAHRKAEEKKAEAEAKRGSKVAKVVEIAILFRALGRPPSKRSFF